MKNAITSTALAITIALTSLTAAPAYAGERDVARFLAGAAALIIIGKVIENESKKKKTAAANNARKAAVARNKRFDVPEPSYRDTENHSHHGKAKHRHPGKAKYGKKAKDKHSYSDNEDRRLLPAQCSFRVGQDDRRRTVFGKSCLNETMRNANRLPQACQDTVRIRHGRDAQVYSANCLSRHGYRVAVRD